MLSFLQNNWGNILVLSILALIITLIIISMIRDKKKGRHSWAATAAAAPDAQAAK